MNLLEADNLNKAQNVLKYLNRCHDGSIKTISFTKKRELDSKTGDLVYDAIDTQEMALCEVEIEMLLNSYEGAKKDQVIILEFKQVKKFRFSQDKAVDYADIYESTVSKGIDSFLKFKFLSTVKKLLTLSISCDKLIVVEK